MKVLVTGAAGFIGSHFIDRLLVDGHTVIGIDKFRLGLEEHLNANKKYKDKLTLIKADISNASNLNKKSIGEVDWVFHLAAKIGNAVSKLDPVGYHLVNVNGTVNVLELARQMNIKKFIYVSTASVYGTPLLYPTPESAKISLDYPYSVTKYIGEKYCLHYFRVYKLPVVITRLFNVYGFKNRISGYYGPTLSIFINQLREGKPLTIRGDGRQKRDFTYVDDVYDAFLYLAYAKYTGEVFNIGNGKAYSMNELTKLLGGKIKYVPMIEKEPHLTLADISKIFNYTGWKPKISLAEGINRVLV